MEVSSWIWILWAALTASWFGVAEYMALSNKYEDDTLSANIQNLISKHKVLWYGSLVIWIGFAIWFLDHIWLSMLR